MAKAKAKNSKSEFRIRQRRNGRFQVTSKGGKSINGIDKVKVLVEAGKIKQKIPAAPKEEAAAAPAEATEEAKTEE